MIKFFQKLKAKKGFTLVELIVVIAIIGVLAAILIPTMLGYVTSSRVTSVNSTAASIKNNIDTFLTNADTAGYGMLKGSANNSTLVITVTGGTWTVTNPTTSAFHSGNGKTWAGTGTGTAGGTKVGVTAPESLLAIELADLFPEVDTASIVAYVEGGKTLAVAYTADTSTALTQGTDCPNITAGATGTTGGWTPTNGAVVFAWDNSTAGVSSSGFIVGTAPIVPLG
ncbi:MAG: type II secretion system protein [Ruminiclostridium sp.]